MAAELQALLQIALRVRHLNTEECPYIRSPADVFVLLGAEMSLLDWSTCVSCSQAQGISSSALGGLSRQHELGDRTVGRGVSRGNPHEREVDHPHPQPLVMSPRTLAG
jgi:hypothetical protein